MNFSQSSSIEIENDCKSFFFQTVPLRYSSSDSFHGLLVAAAVLSLAICFFTIFLNALVMVAVIIKRRLQTHPNILLACLALTDLMVGLVVQPLHIAKTILLIQGKYSDEFCDIDSAFSVSFVMLVLATSCQLVLISGERYLAIKHTFTHASVVTEARLIVASAVAWIAAALFFLLILYVSFLLQAIIYSSIIVLQILVYKEARRHEKHILSQQVSLEARAKFKQEKKALKLTTVILVTIFLCFVLPSTVMFVTWELFGEKLSPDIKTLVRHFGHLPVLINSLLNPVIYTVRKEEFRVAFTELLLRKSLQEAEEFQRRLFGTTNNAGRQQDEQQGVGQEQNAEERNPAHAKDNQDDNPEVLAIAANFDNNTTLALHKEPVSSNALNSTTKEREEEHGEERNPARVKNNLDDNPDDLTSDNNFDGNTTLTTHNEAVSLNALNSVYKIAEEEHDEGRNLTHTKYDLEDNPEVLATGANVDDNTTLATHEPFSSNATTVYPKRQRKNMAREEIQLKTENNLEDTPEVIASGGSIDLKSTETAQSENLSVL